ncbi:hypothetical protein J5N97_020311 [Dioscorea zingiberensis]|uniref:Uncharacterized protein n=1 Tax=Dioscorea zingiberensis TaxID=325984 RepID=A0A9D5CFK5_9LILI|nr:hypothetical protein J5N97_020311 [Dioscorea zingiberensis]
MLERPADSSIEKVDLSEVTEMGDEISKQATVAGMLWSREGELGWCWSYPSCVYTCVQQGMSLTAAFSFLRKQSPHVFFIIVFSAQEQSEQLKPGHLEI